jgi:putative membrane protein
MILDFLVRWFIHTISLIAVVALIPGIYVDRWEVTLVTSLILGFLNSFLKPLILFFMFPLFVFSLGLVTFIVNGLMFYLASQMIKGFYVESFSHAFWGALLFSLISFFLNIFLTIDKKLDVRFYRKRFSMDDGDIIDVEGKRHDDNDQPPKRRIPDL